MKLGILASHPIQYQAPLFRALAQQCTLEVFFAHRQDASGQAAAGYGRDFDWDVDLLGGYCNRFLDNIARSPGVDRFLGCNTPEIAQALRDGCFDAFIVMGWNLLSYWQAVRAARSQSVPVFARGDSQLQSPRNPVVRIIKRLAYPWLLSRFAGHLPTGSASSAYLRYYGVPPEAQCVCPHVVDVARFSTDAQRARPAAAGALSELGLDPERKTILVVGRLIGWKRVDDVIAAVAADGLRDQVQLLVVGDGEMRTQLESMAASAGIRARFAGFRNQAQLPAWYAMAQVLVIASDGNETWGLVANEALACGVPVVVSAAAGCAADLVVHGETGFCFALGDRLALAGALQQAISVSPDAWKISIERHIGRLTPECVAGLLCAGIAGVVASGSGLQREHHG